MLWDCFAASEPAALHKVNGIMKNEDYLRILQHNRTPVPNTYQYGMDKAG